MTLLVNAARIPFKQEGMDVDIHLRDNALPIKSKLIRTVKPQDNEDEDIIVRTFSLDIYPESTTAKSRILCVKLNYDHDNIVQKVDLDGTSVDFTTPIDGTLEFYIQLDDGVSNNGSRTEDRLNRKPISITVTVTELRPDKMTL